MAASQPQETVRLKALVTGARGTVGRALLPRLRRDGVEVVGWDRDAVAIDHYDTMDRHVAAVAPDVVYNLAIGSWQANYEWPSELAWICRQRSIAFIHVSTVMVFSSRAAGPFTLASSPDADAGYGYEKRRAEERVFHQKPDATIARIGWQIGDAPGSNNMIDYLERQTEEHGEVRASTRFLPACSFLEDTADALARLRHEPPGLYMIDSNERWSFFDIARALSERHGRWRVVPSEDFAQDQRMLDARLSVPPLSGRLALP